MSIPYQKSLTDQEERKKNLKKIFDPGKEFSR